MPNFLGGTIDKVRRIGVAIGSNAFRERLEIAKNDRVPYEIGGIPSIRGPGSPILCRMQRRLIFSVLWLLVALLAGWPSLSMARSEASEIYKPNSRLAADLLPIAKAALGTGGDAVVDAGQNSIILFGTPQGIETALELLRLQDRAVARIRLRYRSIELRDLANSGLAIEWDGASAVRIARVNAKDGSELFGKLYRTERTDDFAGELVVENGQAGHIGRGRSVPLVAQGQLGTVVAGVADAERGFTATPVLLGDGRIQIALSNSDAQVDDRGRLDYSGATTTVTVEDGESIVIGSFAEGAMRKGRGGTTYSTRRSELTRTYLIQVDVESP